MPKTQNNSVLFNSVCKISNFLIKNTFLKALLPKTSSTQPSKCHPKCHHTDCHHFYPKPQGSFLALFIYFFSFVECWLDFSNLIKERSPAPHQLETGSKFNPQPFFWLKRIKDWQIYSHLLSLYIYSTLELFVTYLWKGIE